MSHPFRGAIDAAQAGILTPILVGPRDKIHVLAQSLGISVRDVEIIDAPHSQAAAEKAVELVRNGKAELLMKGSLHSEELLTEVTKRNVGLRTDRRISHVFIMDVPTHPQTLFITDAAVNIAPDLEAKHDIVQNAIDLYAGMGLGNFRKSQSCPRLKRSPQKFHRPLMPPRSAKWQTEAKLRAESWMDRSRSTTR